MAPPHAAALLALAGAAAAADPVGPAAGAAAGDAREPALGEGLGWFVVLAFGFVVTVAAVLVTGLELRSKDLGMTLERFMTAGRNVGAGLTVAAIVTQWTWAATLLLAPDAGWSYGLAGPYWYAAGGAVQILFFGMLAVQVKRRAPGMHTFAEFAKARFGAPVHCLMIAFGLLSSMLVSALLLMGGAAAIRDLTGMSAVWASFLIPLLACLGYTAYGGLKASFFAAYLQGAVAFVCLLIFLFSAYGNPGNGGDLYGSAGGVYDGLEQASLQAFFQAAQPEASLSSAAAFPGLNGLMGNDGTCYTSAMAPTGKSCGFRKLESTTWCCTGRPVMDGKSYCRADAGRDCVDVSATEHYESEGCDVAAGERCVASFSTMGSTGALLFGVASLCGNFGKVLLDQSFWQSAVAVKPQRTFLAFLLAGLAWFAVPLATASTAGLVGRALGTAEGLGSGFLSAEESAAGFGPARVVGYVLGSGGAYLLLLQLFMAMSSTLSAEIMAVASLLTYDVYLEYMNPELRERREAIRKHFMQHCESYQDADGRIPVGRLNTLLERLRYKELFVQSVPEEEWTLLASAINERTRQDSVATPELFECLNRFLSQSNPEGAILLRMSRFFAAFFAFLMGFLALWLSSLGFGLGWLYLALGTVLGGAVGPLCVALLMERANGKFVFSGAIFGTVLGVIAWLLQALVEHGRLNDTTLGTEVPMMVGNVVALLVGLAVALGGSLLVPDADFRWEQLPARLPLVDDVAPPAEAAGLDGQFRAAALACLAGAMLLLVLWPLPVYGSAGVFSRESFTAWIVVVCLWALLAGLAVVAWPLVEATLDFRAAKKQARGKDVLSRALSNGEQLNMPHPGKFERIHGSQFF